MQLSELSFLPTQPSLLDRPNVPFIHRDMSWLQFNERVLGEARDVKNPLLERAKFLAISANNLEEFFMIRFASLTRSITALRKTDPEQAERRQEIRDSILENVSHFIVRQGDTFESITSELEVKGVQFPRHASPDDPAYSVAAHLFKTQILPQLKSPEPFLYRSLKLLKNGESALVLAKRQWVRLPKSLPSVLVMPLPGGEATQVFFLDDLVMNHYAQDAMGILRLTRDADLSIDIDEEDPETLPDMMRSSLKKRDLGRPVRLQYTGRFSSLFLSRSARSLRLTDGQLHFMPVTMHLSGFWTVYNHVSETVALKHPEIKYAPLVPRMPPVFENKSAALFEALKGRDVLLHHPYDSFDAFIRFISESCSDKQVLSIEITIYRMDALSTMIKELKKAAKHKAVRVVIELRARFDELNNLKIAEELRSAGCEVYFGFGKLKLHAKLSLITRRENDGSITHYTHLSTGNYNAATAKVYTDLALVTTNAAIGGDARKFFDAVYREQVPSQFKALVSAPIRMHRKLLDLIRQEAEAAENGQKARIVAKVNALVDEEVVAELYRASKAGVKIDLIVRGACSLIPGIQGLSHNIRVISVVDRFLEHSRLYYFASSQALYLSSADWMPRNFFSRLELAYPILDRELFEWIEKVLIPIYLSDTEKAREMMPLGTWKKRTASQARSQLPAALRAHVKTGAIRSQALFEWLASQSQLSEKRI